MFIRAPKEGAAGFLSHLIPLNSDSFPSQRERIVLIFLFQEGKNCANLSLSGGKDCAYAIRNPKRRI